MRAAFTDPQGAMKWRVLPYLGTIATFLVACVALEDTAAWSVALLSLAAFNLLGVVPLRQRRPRDAEVVTKPGVIEIKGAKTRNQRIRAKDITGATTGRTRDGVLVTLQHKRRDQPISLLVADEAEADAIRQALGIGHGGFGTIGWRSIPSSGLRSAVIGRASAAALATLCLTLTLFGATEAAGVFGVLFGVFGVIGMIIGIGELLARPNDPSIVMTAAGLRLRTVRGWFALPYEAVLGLEDHGRAVVFEVPPPYGRVGVETAGPTYGGLAAHDRKVMAAQITAAGQRARGLGPQKDDASGRVEVLRRNGESPRDWLIRLDMQGRLLTSSPGYRGNTLDAQDLWAILEDPEADAELRAAAARVLRHSPRDDARVRIDAAVAAVRDEATNKRLRIAVRDDIDAASQELTALETQETHELYLRRAQSLGR